MSTEKPSTGKAAIKDKNIFENLSDTARSFEMCLGPLHNNPNQCTFEVKNQKFTLRNSDYGRVGFEIEGDIVSVFAVLITLSATFVTGWFTGVSATAADKEKLWKKAIKYGEWLGVTEKYTAEQNINFINQILEVIINSEKIEDKKDFRQLKQDLADKPMSTIEKIQKWRSEYGGTYDHSVSKTTSTYCEYEYHNFNLQKKQLKETIIDSD